ERNWIMATRPKTTRIADDQTQNKPQTTAAGDAPADTFDPAERASSAPADKAAAAAAGHMTVNAIKPVASIPTPAGGNRSETYSAFDQTGKEFTVTHNYDTGATSAVPKG
ncbi:hypothetical protein, partial [Streptomyces sp. P9(2023)]|uniref:hypothetical protein n=2 Tax=cellular organisms TaxID=131567 RepID=UPI0028F4184C